MAAVRGVLTAGTRRTRGGHEGVLRRDGVTVWRCGHWHATREYDCPRRGRSAYGCVCVLVQAVRDVAVAAALEGEVRAVAEEVAAAPFYVSPDRLAEIRAHQEGEVARLRERVAGVGAVLAGGPVVGRGGVLVVAPVRPVARCRWCGQRVSAAGFGLDRGWWDWVAVGLRVERDPRRCRGQVGHEPRASGYSADMAAEVGGSGRGATVVVSTKRAGRAVTALCANGQCEACSGEVAVWPPPASYRGANVPCQCRRAGCVHGRRALGRARG